MAQSDFSLGDVTSLLGAVTALVTAVTPAASAWWHRRTESATTTTTPDPPKAAAVTGLAEAPGPWPTLAFGLFGLGMASIAVCLRVVSTTADITTLRVLAGGSCIVTAALGWRPVRAAAKTAAERNRVQIAGAGLLAGISACIAMLIVS